ncbi:hypothetical protein IFM89_017034, partial [Coptis chinensis]
KLKCPTHGLEQLVGALFVFKQCACAQVQSRARIIFKRLVMDLDRKVRRGWNRLAQEVEVPPAAPALGKLWRFWKNMAFDNAKKLIQIYWGDPRDKLCDVVDDLKLDSRGWKPRAYYVTIARKNAHHRRSQNAALVRGVFVLERLARESPRTPCSCFLGCDLELFYRDYIEIINELTSNFDKCQQLLNSISGSISSKAVVLSIGEVQKRFGLLPFNGTSLELETALTKWELPGICYLLKCSANLGRFDIKYAAFTVEMMLSGDFKDAFAFEEKEFWESEKFDFTSIFKNLKHVSVYFLSGMEKNDIVAEVMMELENKIEFVGFILKTWVMRPW